MLPQVQNIITECLSACSDEVLLLFNDSSSFPRLVDMMRKDLLSRTDLESPPPPCERASVNTSGGAGAGGETQFAAFVGLDGIGGGADGYKLNGGSGGGSDDEDGELQTLRQEYKLLKYHVELVKLLSRLTEGKNVNSEIKCQALLSLDDVVTVLCHEEASPQVKEAYTGFLINCYLETEAEVKEIYSTSHMWTLFKSNLTDVAFFCKPSYLLNNDAFNTYITDHMVTSIGLFFKHYIDHPSIPLSDNKREVSLEGKKE